MYFVILLGYHIKLNQRIMNVKKYLDSTYLKTGAGGLDEKAMSKLRVLFRKLLMRILN
jgi:hypothetical protein